MRSGRRVIVGTAACGLLLTACGAGASPTGYEQLRAVVDGVLAEDR